jgi:hypothetical protein
MTLNVQRLTRVTKGSALPEIPVLTSLFFLLLGTALAFWTWSHEKHQLEQDLESDSQFLISMLQNRSQSAQTALNGLSHLGEVDLQLWSRNADYLIFQYPELQAVFLTAPNRGMVAGVPSDAIVWVQTASELRDLQRLEDTVLWAQGSPTQFWESGRNLNASTAMQLVGAIDPQRLIVECLQDRRLHRRSIEVFWREMLIYSNRMENPSDLVFNQRELALRGERQEWSLKLRPTQEQVLRKLVMPAGVVFVGCLVMGVLFLFWLKLKQKSSRIQNHSSQAYAELRQQLLDATRAKERQHAFLHMLHFEALAPLKAMSLEAEELTASLIDPQKRRKSEDLLFVAQALLQTLADFETRSADTPTPLHLNPMSCEVHGILELWERSHRQHAESRQILIDLRMIGDQPTVIADPHRIWQMVLHLGAFAMEHLEQGVLELHLSQERKASKEVRIILFMRWKQSTHLPSQERLGIQLAQEIVIAHGGQLTKDLESGAVLALRVDLNLEAVE